jgi:hypothetical protein
MAGATFSDAESFRPSLKLPHFVSWLVLVACAVAAWFYSQSDDEAAWLYLIGFGAGAALLLYLSEASAELWFMAAGFVGAALLYRHFGAEVLWLLPGLLLTALVAGGAVVLSQGVTKRFSREEDLVAQLTRFSAEAFQTILALLGGPAGAAKAKLPKVSEGTSITRYALIESSGLALPRQQLTLLIDLTRSPPKSAEERYPVQVSGLLPDWTETDVEFVLSCPELAFDEGAKHGKVVVRRDGASVPAKVLVWVKAEAESVPAIEVVADFFHDGRFAGSARKAIPTAETAAAPSSGKAAVRLEGVPPALTVYIRKIADGLLYWQMVLPQQHKSLPGMPKEFGSTTTLGKDADTRLRATLQKFAKLPPGGDNRATFQGFGEWIFKDLTPACFRETYLALRNRFGAGFPIQFVTNEPSVPWELMRPVLPAAPAGAAGRPSPGPLALEHPVGRWLAKFEGNLRPQLPRGRIAAVAPEYAYLESAKRPVGTLELAKRLVKDFQAVSVTPTLDGFLELLEDKHPDLQGATALLVFAGHGEYDAETAILSHILLDDRSRLTTLEVNRSETVLGRNRHPFVVFNACEVGATGPMLDGMGGWAVAFLEQEFGGFLAPLWRVWDDEAQKFLENLIALIWEGGRRPTVGEALVEVRRRLGAETAGAHAYLYYGDVMARFQD